MKITTLKLTEKKFYDQPINNQETNDLIKQYDELRKVSTGQDDDYIKKKFFFKIISKKNYRLVAADLSKQNGLDADSRAIQ